MTFDRITIDPNMMQGRPCVRGMRITVSLVVKLLANGMSENEVLHNYPDLDEQDIRQCLMFDQEHPS